VLATIKGRALDLEVATIAAAATDGVDGVDCESESFGAGRVSAELRRLAEAGEHVRLLVAARRVCASEARTLCDLRAAGVEVRLGQRGEKLAVAGGRAWVGSANATSASPATLDWGYATGDPGLVAPLRARFEEDWSAGRPLDVPSAPPPSGFDRLSLTTTRQSELSNAPRQSEPAEDRPVSLSLPKTAPSV
jgi:hypothetical protein